MQALLVSQSDLTLSLALAEKLFSKDFPHLIYALKEEVDGIAYGVRGNLGKVLFKAVRFAKYDQLRSARLFKNEWLAQYLQHSQLSEAAFKSLLRQELFCFKPNWP